MSPETGEVIEDSPHSRLKVFSKPINNNHSNDTSQLGSNTSHSQSVANRGRERTEFNHWVINKI